jgi:hypothetical protein
MAAADGRPRASNRLIGALAACGRRSYRAPERSACCLAQPAAGARDAVRHDPAHAAGAGGRADTAPAQLAHIAAHSAGAEAAAGAVLGSRW